MLTFLSTTSQIFHYSIYIIFLLYIFSSNFSLLKSYSFTKSNFSYFLTFTLILFSNSAIISFVFSKSFSLFQVLYSTINFFYLTKYFMTSLIFLLFKILFICLSLLVLLLLLFIFLFVLYILLLNWYSCLGKYLCK